MAGDRMNGLEANGRNGLIKSDGGGSLAGSKEVAWAAASESLGCMKTKNGCFGPVSFDEEWKGAITTME